MCISRRATAGLSLLSLLGLALPSAAGTGRLEVPVAKAKRPIVVELYTSQGCSSCPPADALLAQLSFRKDVLAISLPVTYWDMLGWRDTLANELNTRRQKAYARVLGRGGVYTPQMIVDGVSDIVGSREPTVDAAIAARMADMQSVPISLTSSKQLVHIAIGPAQDRSGRSATIWLFRILPEATVSIRDGENGGRTITYRNVARDIKAVGTWRGQPVTLDLPLAEVDSPHDELAVVVQEDGYGRILGAAMLSRRPADSMR